MSFEALLIDFFSLASVRALSFFLVLLQEKSGGKNGFFFFSFFLFLFLFLFWSDFLVLIFESNAKEERNSTHSLAASTL